MKNRTVNIKILAFAALLTGAFVSCNKSFLEITPKGKLIAQTVADYDLSLNNIDFLTINGAAGGGDAQVMMGDEVAAVEPYFSSALLRTQRLFRWDDVVYEPTEDAQEMTIPMRNIYSYNKIINEVVDATGGTELQKKSIQGEALVGRAWTNFLLINYYGKPYNPATAGSDPGYPIITAADVTATNFTRASVKEVYDFIVNDLTTAIPNLPVQTTHRLRMSKAAAEGLLAKVYVFMGKYNEALAQLNAALTDMGTGTIPVRLYDYNVTFGTGGSFLPIGTQGPAYPTATVNEENIYAKQFQNYWTLTRNEIVVTPQTMSLFGTSDLRRKFYVTTAYPSGSFPAGLIRRLGPNFTQFGVVVPELYLLRAECKARLTDLPGAKADVEALRVKRMPAADAPVPTAIAADQTALVKFILEERIREFAVQGFRWFDMRRLSVDPVFNTTVNYTHSLYSATGSISTFTLRPERFVLRLPQKVIDQNPGMENNP
jgi:hypothetical protein